MFCKFCGKEIRDDYNVCPHCGHSLKENIPTHVNLEPTKVYSPKSKIVAGIFGIILGSLGIHNFYLGKKGRAFAQLLMTVIGTILIIVGTIMFSSEVIRLVNAGIIDDTTNIDLSVFNMGVIGMFLFGVIGGSLMISIASIWGFVEGIILIASNNSRDSNGLLLK